MAQPPRWLFCGAHVPDQRAAVCERAGVVVGFVEMEEVMATDAIKAAILADMAELGIPESEFSADFAIKMLRAMQVSYHKYGKVGAAYPAKFDAASDVRTRMGKYRESGNMHYLVDAANFAMIEAMHPAKEGACWGGNDAADSPGRNAVSGRKLVQEDNDGNRIMGETILHSDGAIMTRLSRARPSLIAALYGALWGSG